MTRREVTKLINIDQIDLPKKLNQSISTLDMAIFFKQLSILISSGIPIVQCFEILQQNQPIIELQLLISSIKTDLERGKALAASLKKYPRYFDDLTCNMVHTGEISGTFSIILKRIAFHKEKMFYLKNKFKQALFYPSIILFIAILITIIMLTFIVPNFAEFFQHTNQSLPILTVMVISLSRWVRNYYWLSTFPIFIFLFLIFYYKRSIYFQYKIDEFLIQLPFVGNLLKKIALIHFTQNLATIFSAGIPMNDALRLVAPTSANSVYTKTIFHLQKQIVIGQQLHRAMQCSPLFPKMLIQMIRVGEECGNLEQILEKISEIYQNETDHVINNLTHLLEPLIMVILGVLIGGLVIAMYLPIFKLGNAL